MFFLSGVLFLVAGTCFVAVSGFGNKPKGNEKTMIVLGAALQGSRVSRMLQYRLDEAYDLWALHPDMLIVTAGGQGPQADLPEGEAMKDYLVARGVPEELIIAETASTNTEENFLFVAELLGAQGIDKTEPITIVTNAFHCYRASLYAHKCGYTQVTTQSAGINPGVILPYYLRELFAQIYYGLCQMENGPGQAIAEVNKNIKNQVWM